MKRGPKFLVPAPDGFKGCPRCREIKPVEAFSDGYCKPCRAARGREARQVAVITPKRIAQFWARVNKDGPNSCWVWQGAPRNHEGYGQFHWGGRNLSPHTIVLILLRGIEGSREVFVDHVCKNRMCCNPDHLRLVTPKQNALENNDSPFAKNAAKTHCKKGHLLAGSNIAYIRLKNPRGTSFVTARQCLICYPSYRNNPNRIYPENRT